MENLEIAKVKKIIELIVNNVRGSDGDGDWEWEIDIDIVSQIYKIVPIKQINIIINKYSDIFDLYSIKAGPEVSDGIFYNGKLISYEKEDELGGVEVLFL